MSVTYTDRYVSSVIKHLPKDQHSEVEAELRSAIADALDAHGGPDAESTVLNAMGDPELLAATYAERPLQLIGPRLFLTWKRLLVLLLWIVVPIVTALNVLSGVLDHKSLWTITWQSLGTAWVTGVMICFWVTVVFAALDRASDKEVKNMTSPWTVDRLPDPSSASVTWSDTIGSAIAIALTAAVLVWQQVNPWAHAADGTGLPIINPQMWDWILPALLVLLAVELVVVIVRHVRGHWTYGDWGVTVALNIGVVALLLPPLLEHTFFNRAAFAVMEWPDAASAITLDNLESLIALGVVVAAIADVVGGFVKARRAAG